jgi:hypothetical protein
MEKIKTSCKYAVIFITALIYSHSAYALIPEIRDQIVNDINVWVFIIAGVLAAIGMIFKGTRRVIFGFLSASIAVYMFWTIIHLAIVTDIY